MDILNFYTAIEHHSRQMLEAARGGDWRQLAALENACAVLIAELKVAADRAPLEPEAARRKAHIMQRILRNDAEVRRLAEPCLEELERTLGSPSLLLH